MPLELGLDLGCRRYGKPHHQEKVILVLDVERYRYQRFLSDIAGQDIAAHRNNVETTITAVRNWLRLELDPSLFKTPVVQEFMHDTRLFKSHSLGFA
jgi:hypothetical protein